MSIIDDIVHLLADIERDGKKPDRIEIGEKQAGLIAEDLLRYHRPHERDNAWLTSLGFEPLHEQSPPPTAEVIYTGQNNWLFGVRVRGVESPDYLAVIEETWA